MHDVYVHFIHMRIHGHCSIADIFLLHQFCTSSFMFIRKKLLNGNVIKDKSSSVLCHQKQPFTCSSNVYYNYRVCIYVPIMFSEISKRITTGRSRIKMLHFPIKMAIFSGQVQFTQLHRQNHKNESIKLANTANVINCITLTWCFKHINGLQNKRQYMYFYLANRLNAITLQPCKNSRTQYFFQKFIGCANFNL